MTPITAAKIAYRIAKLATDKRFWKIVAVIIMVIILICTVISMLPAILVGSIFTFLNPTGDALATDPYYIAIQAVRAELNIENDLPVIIAKSIDMIGSGDVMLEGDDAVPFIQGNFVASYENVTTSLEPDPNNPNELIEVETVEIIYYFYSATEMLRIVQEPPYSFSEQDIRAIQEMYLISEGNIDLGEFTGTCIMPTNGYVTSGYGNRFDPINGKYFMHPALDLLPEWHAPVVAIADGEVVTVNVSEIYGNNVTVKHDVGGKTIYSFSAHLSRVDVREGQVVRQGSTLGLEGGDQKYDPNAGRTTGHHLHFEIWETPSRDGHVNPSKYLKG